MDQIKPGYLALYQQEQQSLADVKTQEDQTNQSLQQLEGAELQAVRQKYDASARSCNSSTRLSAMTSIASSMRRSRG